MTAPRRSRAPSVAPLNRSGRIQNLQPMGQGQQGPGDRTQGTVPLFSSNPETYTDYLSRYRQYVSMFVQSWEARKIVCIPVDDALRKPPTLKGIDPAVAKILKRRMDRLGLTPILKRSLKMERLLGGCLTFMGLDAAKDDPSIPYDPKKDKARLRFVNSIPVSRISRMNWCQDPLSENYMRPSEYTIAGHTVHTSRCLVWDGEPLFDPQDIALTPYRANLAGFGPSVLGTLWDDVIMACGTRQAAYQMIQINGSIIAAIQDLQDITGTQPGQKNLKQVKDMINQLSQFRAAFIDGEKVDVKSFSSPFGSVPELLITYLQVLSAASDIPATRFLGQAPGGLNATGESDLENYYNKIDAYQHERITPQLLRLLDVIGYAEIPEWDTERDSLEIEWPPLWNETEKDKAERAGVTVDYVLKLVDAALMGDEQALEEINARGILSCELKKDDMMLAQEAQDAVSNLIDGGKEDGPSKEAAAQVQRLKNMSTENASFVTHYYNPKTKKLACSQGAGMSMRGAGSARLWTEDKTAVTCVKCKAQLDKWSQIKNQANFSDLIHDAGYDPTQFDAHEVEKGYAVEQEHADVTHGLPVEVMKIVLAHLTEVRDYYTRLEKMELQGALAESKIENQIDLESLPEPTQPQIVAGNYKKHHITVHGLDIAIENPKDSIRKGASNGVVWEAKLPAHYGYIKRTTGADGDHVDVFVGPYPDAPTAYVIDQLDLATKNFDEHKTFIGCWSEAEAIALYCAAFSDGMGFERIGGVTTMRMDEFREWLRDGDTTTALKEQTNG